MSLAELIKDVHRCWREVGFQDDRFADLATVCLERSAPHQWLTLEGILDHTFDPDHHDHREFNPCPDVLTLYDGPRFCICAHLWLDTAVELHHHGWNGAFQLLSGSSVHARYTFRPERIVQVKLRLGELTCDKLELLRAGDTITVPAGAGWIHGLAYNERPSLALSIRATERPEQIRMEYWRPGLAVEAEAPPDQELLRQKAIAFVAGFDPREARDRLARWLAASDLRSAFHLLRFARRLPLDVDAWSALLEVGHHAHGEAFPVICGAVGDHARIEQLQALRRQVHDPELRLLLAGLCFGARSEDVFGLVAARRPNESPREVIRAWSDRLLAHEAVAQSLFGPTGAGSLQDLFGAFVLETSEEAALKRAQDEFDIATDEGAPDLVLREAYQALRRHQWLGMLLG